MVMVAGACRGAGPERPPPNSRRNSPGLRPGVVPARCKWTVATARSFLMSPPRMSCDSRLLISVISDWYSLRSCMEVAVLSAAMPRVCMSSVVKM